MIVEDEQTVADRLRKKMKTWAPWLTSWMKVDSHEQRPNGDR